MENSLRRGIIIDFFGMPGSGKTTIAHMLAGRLEEIGCEIEEPIYLVNNEYSSSRRSLTKIWATLCFTTGHFSYLYRLFSLLGRGAFQNLRKAAKQWVNVCFVLASFNAGRPIDFLIADQGIIQAAISLTFHCEKADIQKIINKLNEQVKTTIIYVYVAADIDEVLKRLQNRTNGGSRLDQEKSIIARKDQLRSVESRCMEVINAFDCIRVDNHAAHQTGCEANDFKETLDMLIEAIKYRGISKYD